MPLLTRITAIILLAGLTGSAVRAGAPAGSASAGIPRDVAAVLARRCGECHGEKAPKSRLTLITADGLARGGRKGPVVRPGKPGESRLWQLVQAGEMPPDDPLPSAERDVLRKWIEAGAPGLPTGAAQTHWAFVPPRRPVVPTVKSAGLRNPIDRFIAAELESVGRIDNPSYQAVGLAPQAGRATLVRRVAFDLTGLPPTPEETEAFLADPTADAYERMVERYLVSPHYGERWGKHWLDAAGYADSNGYFSADSDRPLAWKYRDWVVRSFNADKPFDQFVREQLAGDELAGGELAGHAPGGDVTPAAAELLAATHFLRNAPDGSGESDGNPDEVRTDRCTVLEGNLQIVMGTLLGVTIQCARCHSHKFEPITHEEYYRLQAIFFPVYCPDRWVKPNDRTVTVATPQERDEHQRRTERVERQIQALRDDLATRAVPYREKLAGERLKAIEVPLRESVLQAVRTPKEKLTAEQQALLKKHVEPLKLTDDELARHFPEYAAARESASKAIAEREKERPAPLEKLAVVTETGGPVPAHHLLLRGQHNKPGPEVQPGVPAAFSSLANTFTVSAPSAAGTGRRSALARWVTSKDNPLFARVFVNRVWQWHFGKGLVATPDNFGVSGARPSHPELLDWLAAEFIESGYSVKRLHRLILGSATYRQSSSAAEQLTNPPTATRDLQSVDPDNRLLARFPLRRLDAEALRDALLAVSGDLDRQPGGPYVPTRRTAEGSVEVDEARPDAQRRSIYLQQRRTQVATLLELFDAPSITTTCTARNTSTVPLQALALLNSDFARRRAAAFAGRLRREAGDDNARLSRAFRLACGRPPRDDERILATRFLGQQRAIYSPAADAEPRAWIDFCQMLLASNAFLYVE